MATATWPWTIATKFGDTIRQIPYRVPELRITGFPDFDGLIRIAHPDCVEDHPHRLVRAVGEPDADPAQMLPADHLGGAAGAVERDHRLAVAQQEPHLAERAAAAAEHDRAVDGHRHQRALRRVDAGGDGEVHPRVRLRAGGAGQKAEADALAIRLLVAARRAG